MIGKWSEFQAQESFLRFDDLFSTTAWLRDFVPDDLRRVVQRYDDNADFSRLTDYKLVEHLGRLFVAGYLRARQAGTAGDAVPKDSRPGRGNGAEEALIVRLRVTAKEFIFAGERLRIIRAGQWPSLRASSEGHYQIVSRPVAQATLRKMAEWAAISIDEKAAIAEAIPLLPDLGRRQPAEGVLLVRVVVRSITEEKTSSEPAATPSQVARHQQKYKLHWIEIELLDEEGEPVVNEPYRLELPDGSVRTGRLDSRGHADVSDIVTPGRCRISFPEIDQNEWRAA